MSNENEESAFKAVMKATEDFENKMASREYSDAFNKAGKAQQAFISPMLNSGHTQQSTLNSAIGIMPCPPSQQINSWNAQMASVGGIGGMKEPQKVSANEIAEKLLAFTTLEELRKVMLPMVVLDIIQGFDRLGYNSSRAQPYEVLQAAELLDGMRKLPVNEGEIKRSRL